MSDSGPTVTVVTSAYNTDPKVFARTWASLKSQTYKNWDWLVYDDSTTGSVWQQLWGICADERYRVTPLKGIFNDGNIGRVKRRAFMAAEGSILVELDHDDELTPDALAEVVEAFKDPKIGFVYSDWCEILPSGQSGRYPDGWAFGYGSHYWDDEHKVWVMSSPEINRKTLSHIVSAPNHVRSWRADVYRELGGHDSGLPVADDYELVVRTALRTEMLHIPKLLYKQHIGLGTAQRVRNAQIQTLVKEIHSQYYDLLDDSFGSFSDFPPAANNSSTL